MTSEQWDKLTDEEKRIKIAELCGLTIRKQAVGTGYYCWSEERNRKLVELDVAGQETFDDGMLPFPDYLHDLNAMHEAWLTLNSFQKTEHINWLNKICTPVNGDQIIACCNATAAQRAKAFVLTLTEGDNEHTASRN